MTYFYKNEPDKVIFELPKFQTSIEFNKILALNEKTRSEEINFLIKTQGLTCLPHALHTLLGGSFQFSVSQTFVKKFIEHSTKVTLIFAKIVELIKKNKNDDSIVRAALSKVLKKPTTDIKAIKLLNAKKFSELLFEFLENCLEKEKNVPLFQNISISMIRQYISNLDKTLEDVNQDNKLNLMAWFEHLVAANLTLTMHKIMIDYQSILNLDETQILKNSDDFVQKFSSHHDIPEQHLFNMRMKVPALQSALIQKCGFKQVPEAWEGIKKSGIDGLIRFIRDNGPIVISGLFGQVFYNQLPKFREGKEISYHYWPKNSFSVNLATLPAAHSVIIMGASKKTNDVPQDMVFIIDPANDQKGFYRLYGISCKSFFERVSFELAPLKSTHLLNQNCLSIHPELKPTAKPVSNSFWFCSSATKTVIATAGAALAIGYTMTKNSM